MSSQSRWSTTLAAAGTALLVLGCTPSDEPASAPETAPAAPASQPGQPPPAAAPADQEGKVAPAAKASVIPLIVDELYVDAEAEPDEGTPPLLVSFTSIVEDHSGKYTCEWDFGDGSPKSTELNPRHEYKKEGDFIVVLNCKDEKGIAGETEIDVTVYQYE
jgi:PKD repeat protein